MQFFDDKCLVAGSFDPVTCGHMNIIGAAVMTFSKVVVAIGVNDSKKYFFSLEERLSMLKKACKKYDSVTVTSYEGLTADFMKQNDIKYFVRGVRNADDEKYEEKVFNEISKVNEEARLTLFNCPKELKKVSSTLVRDLIKKGEPYNRYIPYEIIEEIEEYSKAKKQ